MKSISGKYLAKLLERNGWVLSRIYDSHHIYTKKDRVERISIPIHGNKELKIGLLKYILKISEIRIDD
ncbi:MAG TPA: type II toxin-antitoxin system HicA family toxin [Candidatus Kapabacteria bacterium]|nr:type II toxin-antitoxin system HicA family toxin [Candidatus Kapabacteria bacterium]